jgi:hypothetical protein
VSPHGWTITISSSLTGELMAQMTNETLDESKGTINFDKVPFSSSSSLLILLLLPQPRLFYSLHLFLLSEHVEPQPWAQLLSFSAPMHRISPLS